MSEMKIEQFPGYGECDRCHSYHWDTSGCLGCKHNPDAEDMWEPMEKE